MKMIGQIVQVPGGKTIHWCPYEKKKKKDNQYKLNKAMAIAIGLIILNAVHIILTRKKDWNTCNYPGYYLKQYLSDNILSDNYFNPFPN